MHYYQLIGGYMQYYKVFYTDKPLPAGGKPDYGLLMPLDFAYADEALQKAFDLIYGGGVVWKIEGPEGFHLDRAEIERDYFKFSST